MLKGFSLCSLWCFCFPVSFPSLVCFRVSDSCHQLSSVSLLLVAHSGELDTSKLRGKGRTPSGHPLLVYRIARPLGKVSILQRFCRRALESDWACEEKPRRKECCGSCACCCHIFHCPRGEVANILLGNVRVSCQCYQSQMFPSSIGDLTSTLP